MRLNATRLGSIASSRSFGDQLDDLAGQVPSLDLNFAQNKSLIDDYSGTTLVTHTRASSGTFVDSDGVLRSAVTNLLVRSEEFDDAAWLLSGCLAFGSGSTANATTAPDGSSTADLITQDAGNSLHALSRSSAFSVESGKAYTLSVFLKSNGVDWAFLQLNGNIWSESGDRPRFWFNLSTGEEGSSDRNSGVGLTSFGNGWYRAHITATASTNASTNLSIAMSVADGNNSSYTGDGTSGIYLWGAQLEQSSTVGEYIPTTSTINSAPRFDHNPTTGESLGLLVEEQRTNTLLQSNQFDTSWTLDTGNPTISLVSQTAPDGGAQSWKLTEGTSTGFQDIFQTGVSNSSGSSVYSVYAKAAERFKLSLRESTSTGTIALFDLSAGSVVVVSGGGTPSPTATITPVKNGWYRCSVLFNQSTTSNRTFRIFVVEDAETTANGSIASRTGDGTSGFYLWGAQLEAGSKATSYIPTTTATVTRAADVASITGSNFSSWYRQDEGTMFAAYQGREGNASKRVFAFTDDSSSNIAWLIASNSVGSQANYWQVRAGGVVQAELGSGAYSAVPQLSAAAYRADDFGFSKNGGAPLTDTSGSIPVVNTLRIGAGPANTDILNGTIRRLTFWPTRLGNEVLQRITQ